MAYKPVLIKTFIVDMAYLDPVVGVGIIQAKVPPTAGPV